MIARAGQLLRVFCTGCSRQVAVPKGVTLSDDEAILAFTKDSYTPSAVLAEAESNFTEHARVLASIPKDSPAYPLARRKLDIYERRLNVVMQHYKPKEKRS
jgi:hypothetical protein